MSDKALENAMAKRDELAVRINQAQQQIDEWRREIARVDAFIWAWHDFAGVSGATELVSEAVRPAFVQPSMLPLGHADAGVVEVERPKRTRNNSRKEDVAEGAREIIAERGQPVPRSELFKALLEKGYIIEGTDPGMVLSTMLWRMRHRVARLKTGGYWLAEVPCPEAGYEPDPEGGGEIDLADLDSDGSQAIERE